MAAGRDSTSSLRALVVDLFGALPRCPARLMLARHVAACSPLE
jgi:hypothetical protein